MSTPAGYRVGRGWLQVTPGASRRLFLHDIGAPAPGRTEALQRAHQAGVWTYVQRGHAPSTLARGGVYRISEFTLDLLRLLHDVIPTPVLLCAEGASALVSALAAATEPGLVRGLALSAGREGWGSHPELLVSDTSEPNPGWLPAIQERSNEGGLDDDPMLRIGPPETMPEGAVTAALSSLALPWAASKGHFMARWLPDEHRLGTVGESNCISGRLRR